MATPHEELKHRLEGLQQEMRKAGIGGALIEQRVDLFYFSGTAQQGQLLIPAAGEPCLLVRKNLERARRESALKEVEPFEGSARLAELVRELIPAGSRFGLELDVLPANLYFRYRKLFDTFDLVDVSPLIRRLRAVKSPYEIGLMRQAAALSTAMFNYAREIITAGMTEIELAAQLEAFVRARGHQGAVRMRTFNQEMFYDQIMCGANAAAPSYFDGPTGGNGLSAAYPQGAGRGPIRRNETIFIDFVTVLDGYMVDQTRIFCLGQLPEKLRFAHRIALQIKEELMQKGKAGSSGRDLYEHALSLAAGAGLEDYFMGAEEKIKFIGHGVGLELDELPVIARNFDLVLEPGMVIALEPKFIFPRLGVVGVEDTFIVRPDGLEPLTSFDDTIQYL